MVDGFLRNKSCVEVVELFTDLGSPLGVGCSGSLGKFSIMSLIVAFRIMDHRFRLYSF